MAQKVKLKVLTHRQAMATLGDNDSSLYVRNIAKPVGNLNFVAVDSGGVKRTVTVNSNTFIPIDLTVNATKRALLESPDFKKFWQVGALEIIDTDAAEEAFATNPKFKEERDRLFGGMSQGQEDIQEDTITQINAEPVAGAEVDIDPFVQNLLLEEDATDVAEMLQLLDSRLDTLALADVQYIIDVSKVAELRSWGEENKGLFDED